MPDKHQSSPCPLDASNSGSDRYNPKNRETALCYQLHDSLRAAFAAAHVDPSSFGRALDALESHIWAYRQTTPQVNGHPKRKASPRAKAVATRKYSDISEEEFRAKVGYVNTAMIEMRDDEKSAERYPDYRWHDMEWREMIESPLFDGKYWRRLFKINSVETAKEQILEIAKATDFTEYNKNH